uniref:Uncharacterized protein n=1 Tax=Clytia hemisphaerica TaxID=252671 RepID=A0A7M5UKB9_9CNID
MEKNINQTKNDRTYCYQLPVAIGNSTFCGLNKNWESRFRDHTLLAMTIIPIAIYWIVLFAFIKTLYETLVKFKTWRTEESQKYLTGGNRKYEILDKTHFEMSENVFCGFPCCIRYKYQLLNAKLYVSIVLMALFRYFWDAIDLTLDLYIFYQLEKGEVLDPVIYRNAKVNNLIYGFAILGCICKVFTWKFFQVITENYRNYKYSEIKFLQMKNMVMVASFMFEDGPELILEYFYIEKYVTSFSLLLLVKDIFVGILAIITFFTTLIYLIKDRKAVTFGLWFRTITISQVFYSMLVMSITFSNALRVGGACYQYVTKKLRRSCFIVGNGVILQTPFTSGCMRGIDYVIILMAGIPLMFFAYAFWMNLFLSCLWLHSDRKYKGKTYLNRHILNRSLFRHMIDIHGGLMFSFFCRAGKQTLTFLGSLKCLDCRKPWKKNAEENIIHTVSSVNSINLNDARICYESAV